jgi:A/G-specific adenine glycosylase
MAGMWELPELTPQAVDGDEPLLRVRHSITDTDYIVSVYGWASEQVCRSGPIGQWFTPKQRERLALTGLARKILRRLNEKAG